MSRSAMDFHRGRALSFDVEPARFRMLAPMARQDAMTAWSSNSEPDTDRLKSSVARSADATKDRIGYLPENAAAVPGLPVIDV